MSTFALPRAKPSRKLAELSCTRLRNPPVVGGQQGQVVALVANAVPDRRAVVDQIGLEADDWLDVVRPAGLVEVDRAVHHPVVGEAEGGHAELGRPLHHRVDLAGPVEQRILAVDMQMDRRIAHTAMFSAGEDGARTFPATSDARLNSIGP